MQNVPLDLFEDEARASAAARAARATEAAAAEAAAAAVAEKLPLANRLKNALELNPEVQVPKELFASACPRICVPLGCTLTEPNATFAHELAAAINRSEDAAAAPSPTLAVVLLAAARREGLEKTASVSFKSSYSWLFGEKAARDHGERVQYNVLKALGYELREVKNGKKKIPAFLAYVENEQKLWLFFVDGRVDYSRMLCPTGAAKPLCEPMEQAIDFGDSAVDAEFVTKIRVAIDECNQYSTRSFKVTALLNSTRPPFNGIDHLTEDAARKLTEDATDLCPRVMSIRSNDVAVKALARFMPLENEEFLNTYSLQRAVCEDREGFGVFKRVDCASHMQMILALPSPKVRVEFARVAAETLRPLPVKNNLIAKLLEMYDRRHQMHPLDNLLGEEAQAEQAAVEAASAKSTFDGYGDEHDFSSVPCGRVTEAEEELARKAIDRLAGVMDDASVSETSGKKKTKSSKMVVVDIGNDDNDDAMNYDDHYDVGMSKPDAGHQNKNVRVHIGRESVYAGRMVNLFGVAAKHGAGGLDDDEENGGTGTGLSSLFTAGANLDAIGNDARDDEEGGIAGPLRNIGKDAEFESFSGTGVAMQEKFEKMNVFRRYRRLNEAKLREICMQHERGTADYNDAMRTFKKFALRQATDAFFGMSADSDTNAAVSAPIKETRQWLRKNPDIQMPEMYVIMKHDTLDEESKTPGQPRFGPFCNFIMHLMRDLDAAFTPDALMDDAVLLVMTSMAGAWHYDNLRPNILLSGDGSVGKSYLLKIATKLVPDGVSFQVTAETARAGLVDGMHVDVLLTKEELNQHELGTDEYGRVRDVDSTQKDRLTNHIRTVFSLEVIKDQKTGQTVRVQKCFHNCEEMGRHAATNAKLPPRSSPSLLRWCVRPVNHNTDPDHSICDLITAANRSDTPQRVAIIQNHWKAFFTIQLYIEKMIEARAIAPVNLNSISEMSDLLHSVQRTYNFKVEDPKVLNKLSGTARLMTVSYAIYCAVCSEAGEHFRVDRAGRPRQLHEVAVEIAMEVEKHLVLTREITVYVFSLLRTEWLPSVRLHILETIRDMYFTGKETTDADDKEGSQRKAPLLGVDPNKTRNTAGGAKARREYCGPPDSRIEEYDRKGLYRDSTFIALSDTNGSTHIAAVAEELVHNMKGRQMSRDIVVRELEAMMHVRVHTKLMQHEKDCRNRNLLPRPLIDPETNSPVELEMPLFFCGRLPQATIQRRQAAEAANALRYADVPRHGTSMGGFGSRDPAPPPPQSEYGGSSALRGETAAFARGPVNKENNVFACMILFDAVHTPTDPGKIIENAVQSLSHKFMSGDQQTLLISGPSKISVAYPNFLGGANSKKQHQMLVYTIPRTVTIHRTGNVRMLNNPKTLMAYHLAMERIGSSSKRHQIAMRTMATIGMDSRQLVMLSDPDATAMIAHHKMIGITPDGSYYWHNFIDKLCETHEARGLPYVTREEMISNHARAWQTSYAAKEFAKQKNPSATDIAHLVTYVGSADAAWGLKTVSAKQSNLLGEAAELPLMNDYHVDSADRGFLSTLKRGSDSSSTTREIDRLRTARADAGSAISISAPRLRISRPAEADEDAYQFHQAPSFADSEVSHAGAAGASMFTEPIQRKRSFASTSSDSLPLSASSTITSDDRVPQLCDAFKRRRELLNPEPSFSPPPVLVTAEDRISSLLTREVSTDAPAAEGAAEAEKPPAAVPEFDDLDVNEVFKKSADASKFMPKAVKRPFRDVPVQKAIGEDWDENLEEYMQDH